VIAAEGLQSLTRGAHTTLLYTLDALSRTLKCIGRCGDVEQALIFGTMVYPLSFAYCQMAESSAPNP
jgi:hypothetical protein